MRSLRQPLPLLLAWAIGAIGFGIVGCTPHIGDSCKLSTDCSVTGDRLCDTSMPDGYCTIFACESDHCPSSSSCLEFHPDSDRFSRRFCASQCSSDSDCRPGYVCVAQVDTAGVDPARTRDFIVYDKGPQSHYTYCLP